MAFKLTDSGATHTLDRPRVQPVEQSDAPLVIEGPDEEIIRVLCGRHFIPSTQPKLKTTKGTAQDLANLRRAFR